MPMVKKGDDFLGRLINKLERKFGRYAIHNLALYIIGAYVIGYIFAFINTGLMDALTLNPYRIFHGEIWRLVTWVLVPPSNFNFFTVIMLFFYFSLAKELEYTWGAFRFNLYIFSGIIMTIIGAIAFYFVSEIIITNNPAAFIERVTGTQVSNSLAELLESGDAGNLALFKDVYYKSMFSFFSTYYINLSIFLAFAFCYPDMRVMLYFIIPVKIKWMAYLDVAILAFESIVYIRGGMWAGVVAIVVSLLNFIIFFLSTRNLNRVSPKEIHRRRAYTKQVNSAVRIVKHKCSVCGKTNEDDDSLEFRFCSKCDGNYEYCKDHLFTHEHIKFK